jgi:hypothetical protein
MLVLIILGLLFSSSLTYSWTSAQEEFNLLSRGMTLLLSAAAFSILAPASSFDSHGLNNLARFSFT